MSRCLDAVGEVLAISNVASSARGNADSPVNELPVKASSRLGKNKGHNSRSFSALSPTLSPAGRGSYFTARSVLMRVAGS